MNGDKNIPDADFSFVRYANCWEDASILLKALRPNKGRRILSIASAGDNSLAMLVDGAEVVAVDLNPAQLACAELRGEAIRELELDRFLKFAGIAPSDNRLDIYADIRSGLSDEARRYWDARGTTIAEGFVHAGKFENYFSLFRKRVLPLIHGGRVVEMLMEPKSEAEREKFYERAWNNRRWRFLFKVFFSKRMMGWLGRDPAFFKRVDAPVAKRIFERVEYALTKLDTSKNPYLDYILTGNYTKSRPYYLLPENYDAIRKNIDNLTLRPGTIDAVAEEYGPNSFDGFNLSDIFEYLSPEQCLAVYARLLESARPNARLAYWNMLVPQTCPAPIAGKVELLETESRKLFLEDMAFFYSRFIVERVL